MRQLMTAAALSVLVAACASETAGTGGPSAATAAAAADAMPDVRTATAQIEAAEKAWGEALLRKDQAALEQLLAPEFVLDGAGGRAATRRDEWLTNLALMEVTSYAARVTDVRLVGNTAVATVEGAWTVTAFGQPARLDRFVVEDTWVRRGGAWRATRRTPKAPATAAG